MLSWTSFKGITAAASTVLATSFGCAPASGPSEGLETALSDLAAAHDTYYESNDDYPSPFEYDKLEGVSQDELERWNIVVNVNRELGYCIEGDDETGTWHLVRNAKEPTKGDCPS